MKAANFCEDIILNRTKTPIDLLLINAFTLLLIIVITIFPSSGLRLFLGAPFVIFFPGYTFISALFPRNSSLGGAERVGLGFALSLAIVAFVGMILNLTPWGIRLYPLLVTLSGFIVAGSLLAWGRRSRLPAEERFALPPEMRLFRWKEKGPFDKVTFVVMALLILATVGTIGYVVGTPKVVDRFTEFYFADGLGANFPNPLRMGATANVSLGIVNQEGSEAVYRIQVRESGTLIEEVGPIHLEHKQRLERSIEFVPISAGDGQTLEFLLFKGEENEPYRRLRVSINVGG